ncbi:MAG: indole-3-glycerol phosphate synthase TrpC [Candidatus Omnitrophica bacterium]|nr:indole-3-glycerol phosphate synthase TrpC [Candidatus Omnitrophota bacterium]
MAKVDTLKEIIIKKKERIALAKTQLPQEELMVKAKAALVARPFIKEINKIRQISLIAEIKKASPSLGVIRQDFNHLEIAGIYQELGVQAISVITEEDYFQGSLSFINDVKNIAQVPILRKDFIIDAYQVYESRFFGADAILLIADLLTQDEITEFIGIASGLGMDALVEVHDEKELKKVLKLKCVSLIGINNRNLHTLDVDFKITEKLYPLIPKDKVVVIESGIKSAQDVLFLKILGVNAVLIGTTFMQAENIGSKVQELMGW